MSSLYKVLRILDICGEAEAGGTAWQQWVLQQRGPVRGAMASPTLRPQLVRFVIEAFWQLHFDVKHPMQRRMVVVPLHGPRDNFKGQTTLLRVIQPSLERDHHSKAATLLAPSSFQGQCKSVDLVQVRSLCFTLVKNHIEDVCTPWYNI